MIRRSYLYFVDSIFFRGASSSITLTSSRFCCGFAKRRRQLWLAFPFLELCFSTITTINPLRPCYIFRQSSHKSSQSRGNLTSRIKPVRRRRIRTNLCDKLTTRANKHWEQARECFALRKLPTKRGLLGVDRRGTQDDRRRRQQKKRTFVLQHGYGYEFRFLGIMCPIGTQNRTQKA